MQELFTVAQAAKILKVNKNYIYQLIYTNKLKAIRLSERRFRISQQALDDFIRQEEEQAIYKLI